MAFARALADAAREAGLTLSDGQREMLAAFWSLVLEANERHNLTAIVDPHEAAVKHFVDSLTPLLVGALPRRGRLADVGSGAGFPGIPLAIAAPELEVTLIESVGKKAAFLRHAVEALGLRAHVLAMRAEAVGRDPRYRETFDAAVARALAPMPVASEWCLPLVRPGGRFVAMRGARGEEDLEEARRAIGMLGGKPGPVHGLELPRGAGRRVLIVVEKVRPTPSQFPREGGAARRRPL